LLMKTPLPVCRLGVHDFYRATCNQAELMARISVLDARLLTSVPL